MKIFKVTVCKMIERDYFETGCDPDTCKDMGEVLKFQSSDLQLVFSRIIGHTPLDLQDLKNAEPFEGRLETSILETSEADKATERQIELWKLNEIPLWHASYTISISSFEETDLDAFETLKRFLV